MARRGEHWCKFILPSLSCIWLAGWVQRVHPSSRLDAGFASGKISDHSVTIAEVLKASGYFTAMTGKWHLGQQNGTPPWKRGFDRSLNIRAGGIFFPNQSSDPNDPLSSRAKEPLYLNGVALPQTAPEFGRDWYSTYLWTDFWVEVH